MTDRRTALLDAAVAEIASRGTRGMRVETVASAAGVSTALIYHHFGDRSSFLREALEHIGNRAEDYTNPPDGTARSMLIDVLVDEIQDDPNVRTNSAAWGELRDSAVFDDELRPTIARLTQRWINDIAELVREGHADGSIDPSVEPDATGFALSALVEGISGRWLTDQIGTDDGRSSIRRATEALLDASA
jgi:AcrR family transcriptional regulator